MNRYFTVVLVLFASGCSIACTQEAREDKPRALTAQNSSSPVAESVVEAKVVGAVPTDVVREQSQPETKLLPMESARSLIDSHGGVIFPAPRWKVGDWWLVETQIYLHPEVALSFGANAKCDPEIDPKGERRCDGWAKRKAFRFEVVDEERIDGVTCFVVEMRMIQEGLGRYGYHRYWYNEKNMNLLKVVRDWERTPEVDVMLKLSEQQGSVLRYPIVEKRGNLAPYGRGGEADIPQTLPLWRNSGIEENATLITKEEMAPRLHEKLAKKPFLWERAGKLAEIEIANDEVERQYWIEGLPWCVYDERYWSDGTIVRRYWLIDYGSEKGETR